MEIKNIAFESPVVEMTIGSTGKRARFEPVPVTLDLAALPLESLAFALAYGLKQYIADGAAGSEDQAGYKLGIDQRVQKLIEADFTRTRGEGGAKPDSEESRARKLATAFIREKLKAANAKAEAKQIAESAAKLVAADPKWKKLAAKQLAEEAKVREAEPEDAEDDVIGDLLASLAGAAEAEETEESE